MNSITITLPDDRLRALRQLSQQLNIAPEELVKVSIEDLLSRPEDAFQRAMAYVLDKNRELHQRLAA